MLKKTAVAFFEGNQAALARAIGVSKMTVHGWPEVIPLELARAIEIATNDAVPVRESLYPRLVLAKKLARMSDRERMEWMREKHTDWLDTNKPGDARPTLRRSNSNNAERV